LGCSVNDRDDADPGGTWSKARDRSLAELAVEGSILGAESCLMLFGPAVQWGVRPEP
jgi:hypothetical protein